MSTSTRSVTLQSRRTFLSNVAKAGAVAAGYPLVNVFVPSRANAASPPAATAGMNLILFLTDQERAIQWFPQGWAEANLPAMTSLKTNGISFERAYTPSCMCTPARNCLFTGKFPAQHRSFDTLTEGFPQSEAEHQLDPSIPNLATVLKDAGYEVVYKGKWHLSKGVDSAEGFRHDDISRYGFDAWDAPDAGQDVKIENYGGGAADHDTRYINDAIAYLEYKRDNPGDRPFCLVVSLVNPHDVLGYPKNVGLDGYTDDYFEGDLELPPTVDEDLLANFKPTCQRELLLKLNGLGPLLTHKEKRAYLNFYGNLLKLQDKHLQSLLEVFSKNQAGEALRSNTLIVRTSDHGEMGMSHGGMRQKTFNCYEETIRIPMIWSNPELFPTGRVSHHLISHVDFLPTVCGLLSTQDPAQYQFSGVDYSSLLLDPEAPPVQDYVLFTFDDIYAGQSAEGSDGNGIVGPPNRLQMIRDANYKYVRYFDGSGKAADQQEFYDLRPADLGGTDTDPLTGQPVELRNLSQWAESRRVLMEKPMLATDAQRLKRAQMMQKLEEAVAERLTPRPVGKPHAAEDVQIRTVSVTDEDTGETRDILELTFLSRWGSNYQLQQADDLLDWHNVGEPIPGNNGPILISQPLSDNPGFYRVVAKPAYEIRAYPA